MTLNSVIARALLFEGLSDNQLRKIKFITVERRYQKGDAVFWEGDEGTGFYIVSKGKVKIFKVSSEGKEQILHIYGPGQPFGEVPVFAGRNFPASAQALEKCDLLFFPRDAFVDLISKHPSLALNMLAVLSMRLRQFTIQVENLSLKEVPGRLASYLIYLADEDPKQRPFGANQVMLPISKGQLASLLGTIPETLSRIFNRMSSQGMITVQGGTIMLENRKMLESLAVNGRLEE